MSIEILDYLPFDYKRYIHEIQPTWRQALTGNMRPLKDLVQSASHFSLWPCIHCPTIVPKADFTYMLERHFDSVGWNELYLSQEHKGENIAPWNTLWPIFQPAPPDLAAQMLSPRTYHEYASTYTPRSFYAQLDDPSPSGFLTARETQRLVSQLRRHEAPQIDTIILLLVRFSLASLVYDFRPCFQW